MKAFFHSFCSVLSLFLPMFLLFFVVLALSSPAHAQDQVYLLYGKETRLESTPAQKTFAFQLEYMHDLDISNGPFSYSLAYGNQGHFNQGIEHHRDYFGGNFWVHTDRLNNNLRLAVGLGPLYYLDTTGGPAGFANQDVHGFGMSYSLAATLYTFRPVLIQVRATLVKAGSFDTRSVMVGLGYELNGKPLWHFGGPADDEQAAKYFAGTKNEVTLYGGRALVNVSATGHANAYSLEYRRDLGTNFQGSLGLLDEGKSAVANRRGVTGELWATKSFYDNRLTLGAGGGVYLAHDSVRPGPSIFVTPVISVTAAYQLTRNLTLRTTWDRVITSYNRDADVYQFGLGYRF